MQQKNYYQLVLYWIAVYANINRVRTRKGPIWE